MNTASVSEPECENGFLLHWKIRNYRMCALDRIGYIESPEIKMSDIFIDEFQIKLYPWNKNDFNCLGLSIENKGMKQELSVDIAVLTTKGKFSLFKGEIDFMLNDIHYVSFKDFRHDDVIKGDSIFIVDDALTLCCHFSNYLGIRLLITCSALTHIEVEKRIFTYSFYRISEKSVGKKIQNYTSSVAIGKSYFDVSLQITSLNNDARIYFHRRNNENHSNWAMKAKISVVCSDGNLRHTSENHKLFYADEMSCYFNLGFCLNQLLKDRNLYIKRNDYLTLHCEFITSGKMFSYIEEYIEANINKDAVEFKEILPQTIPSNPSTPAGCEGLLALKEDFKNLLKEKTLSDVVVRTRGREFPVHKNILSARSPVFRSMFESDMKEKRSGVVQIDDIDSDTMDTFLKYLYVGSVDNLKWDTAVTLYSTADKYQVGALKNECSSFLSSYISEKNVCDFLILADMHQDANLKQTAQEVFCTHSKNVLLSNEWINLMQKHTNLATEILRMMATKM